MAEGRCLECGVLFERSVNDNGFMCNECRDEAADDAAAHVLEANEADPVLLQV